MTHEDFRIIDEAPPRWIRPPNDLDELAAVVIEASLTWVDSGTPAEHARTHLIEVAALRFAEDRIGRIRAGGSTRLGEGGAA